ncbi:cytochrome C biogenesis protein CcmC [Tistrella bauzanensis]|uniref:Heme exporter protein C n=1 Tax=Tistrella bauzanensis TaxID=657419 RepID=A0ABQ1IDI9_9PROT|nr:heme ABC transporter permease [Tistrella bauzanensis]GGB33933.1 cytochrome C biogenesis protein CcmC [Tistrella bauzanensis]
MHRYANPTLFGRIIDRVRGPATLAGLALIAVGLYLGLFVAPPDYQQGESFRIMYVHVPAAWMSMFAYAGLAVSSAVYLIWRHGVADVAAKAIAPAGAAFTAIALVSGALWGQPMWGTWWVWDARLTSVLLLFFLYLGYMVLRDAFDSPERGARAAGILAVVGVVNLPIIKFSVDWWNTLHQPATISKLDAPSIHPSMLWPLLLMALGFTLLFVGIVCLRARAELLERRARTIEMQAALGGE